MRTLPLVLLSLGLVLAPPSRAEASRPTAWKDYQLAATLEGHTNLVRSLAFAPDGATLATGGADRALRLWDPATGKVRAVHELPPGG